MTTKSKAAPKKAPTIEDDPLAGMSVMERAEMILGTRLTQDFLSYKLDGKRVSVFEIVRAAGLKLERA